MPEMLANALEYARRGWFVFPCREKPGASFIRNGEEITPKEKQPYVARGLDDATQDEDQIRAWWRMWPDAMIGVNAGLSGLFVVDIDKKHVNGLDEFTSWNINDSAGLHSITPSGGVHIVFSGTGKTSSNARTGIDTRGEGGYFIAPPSVILIGENAGSYKTLDDWGRVPGVIPDGLMGKLFPESTVEYVRGANSLNTTGERRQLSRTTLNFLVDGAQQGERNFTLFKVLADFAGCGYSEAEAKEIVMPTCVRIGLGSGEVEQVLKNAFSKPRTASIPDSIQEKIETGGKNLAGLITPEEHAIIEDALLASMIVDNSIVPTILDLITFSDFADVQNRVIFKAIATLYNAGNSVDLITVSTEVGRESKRIKLDDVSKIINMNVLSTENAVTYANIVREKASIRKLEALMDNKQKYLFGKGAIEAIAQIEKEVSNIALYAGANSSSTLDGAQAVELLRERTLAVERGEITQLTTGFVDYDNHIGGIYSFEVVMVAAKTGEGKSALALSLANHVGIRQGKGVLFVNLEMSTHETVCRLICQLTGIPFRNVYNGKMTEAQWKLYKEAQDRIINSGIMFDDTTAISVPQLRSKIRKVQERRKIDLIIVDQLEQVGGHAGEKPFIRLDNISYELKDLSKDENIPMILNHQFKVRSMADNKAKDRDPELSDLNQAGEKAMGQIWGISHMKDQTGKIIKSKIRMLKNRNGPTIEFPTVFLGDRFLFSNPVREEDKNVFHGRDHFDDAHSEPDWARD